MKLWIVLVLFFVSGSVMAQDGDIMLPDSMVQVVLQPAFTRRIDTMKLEFKDTLYEPNCYAVVSRPRDYVSCISILFRNDSGWTLYRVPTLSDNEEFMKSQRVKIDNTGSKELLLRTYSRMGVTSRVYGDGWGETEEYVYLIDLDEHTLLFSANNYFSHLQWSGDGISPMETTCEHYLVTVSLGYLSFKESGNCNDYGEAIKSEIEQPAIINYSLKEKVLVRMK